MKKKTFAIKVNKQDMKSNNNKLIQILKDNDSICWQREIINLESERNVYVF